MLLKAQTDTHIHAAGYCFPPPWISNTETSRIKLFLNPSSQYLRLNGVKRLSILCLLTHLLLSIHSRVLWKNFFGQKRSLCCPMTSRVDTNPRWFRGGAACTCGVFVCAVGDRTGTLLMPIFGTISPLSSSLSSIPFTGWSISSSTQAKKEARLALWRRTIPCRSKLFTQPPWLVMLLSSEIKRRCLFLSTLGKKEGGNT